MSTLALNAKDKEEQKKAYLIAGGATAGIVGLLFLLSLVWIAFRTPVPPPGQKEYVALGAIDFGNNQQGSKKINNFQPPSPTPADNPPKPKNPQPEPAPKQTPPEPAITTPEPADIKTPTSNQTVTQPSETQTTTNSSTTTTNTQPQETIDGFEMGGSDHGQNGDIGNSGNPNATVLNDDVYTWGAGGGNGLANRNLVKKVDPVYISGVQQEGTVVFKITIAPNGTVKRVSATTPYTQLKQMGYRAIKKWRFSPINPRHGDQTVSVGIKFQLR